MHLGTKIRIISLVLLGIAGAASAHEKGTSRFSLNVGERSVESRFQIDFLTLLRLVPDLDQDRDNRISKEEANAGAPRVAEYLAERVKLDVDGEEVDDWGEALPLVWPDEEGRPVDPADYHRLLVQFPFRRKVVALPADVCVTFDVFVEFGANHRVYGEVGCGEENSESVVFNHFEPDYLFDVDHALKVSSDSKS